MELRKEEKCYIAIDLKSFYASVECVERGLDALDTNLVVADQSRTSKTICLAVSPALKAYGIPGRARLFEVEQKLREVNANRRMMADGKTFNGSSYSAQELQKDKNLEIDLVIAPPRMALYIEYSTMIYNIYLKYIAPEDIHVYSIDEVFMDVTKYLPHYKLTAKELAMHMIHDIMTTTRITATAGIGTNLYLCKVAMDIVAKHTDADENGVRMAELDEMKYRQMLWDHQPITDFWRVGRGYARKLAQYRITTMGQIAKCSVGKPGEYYNEDLLYHLFGINAELLIDHAWGYEPCTIKEIKDYRPEVNCLSSGQVLQCPYEYDKAKIVVREMAEALSLDLVEKRLVTDQIVLTINYDIENLKDQSRSGQYHGEIRVDYYGRKVPEHAHGTVNLGEFSSSSKRIIENTLQLYKEIVNPALLIRRINITANHVIPEREKKEKSYAGQQMDLFTDYEALEKQEEEKREQEAKERRIQEAMIAVKNRFGKNALIKGTDMKEGATGIQRNGQIGGHKA